MVEVAPDTYQGRKKMKKNRFYLWAMMVIAVLCIGFTSCGDDDEDDNNGRTSLKAMAGYWNISTLKYSMVLFNEGVMKGRGWETNSRGDIIYGNITTGNWNYDEQTKTLATSALYNNNSLQWLITMLNDDNWTGVALWNDKNTTYMANNKLDVNEVALLLDGKWVNDAGNTLTFYGFSGSYNKYYGDCIYLESYRADEAPQIDLDNLHNKQMAIKFNQLTKKKDQITLHYYSYDHDNDFYEGKIIEESYTIIIINPYSYNNRQLQMNIKNSSYKGGKIVENYRFDAMKYHFQN